ncbi:hypothetical protein MPH_08751 [Macrophomina phaseolina MS6]|uniref:Uncharacterized protein n=1 Tax=Macrophomina phaseolina (strain MS6) TaxID=1126212 RepID=K2RV15_MACPH|nr:hypothetical protein MPH_08751 [Macrophomina phaseolina MS6]
MGGGRSREGALSCARLLVAANQLAVPVWWLYAMLTSRLRSFSRSLIFLTHISCAHCFACVHAMFNERFLILFSFGRPHLLPLTGFELHHSTRCSAYLRHSGVLHTNNRYSLSSIFHTQLISQSGNSLFHLSSGFCSLLLVCFFFFGGKITGSRWLVFDLRKRRFGKGMMGRISRFSFS